MNSIPERESLSPTQQPNAVQQTQSAPHYPALRFDRREFSGAFGDIGTDLPLLAALSLIEGISPVNLFMIFGIMQILSGLFHRIPMAIQPLKAVSVIVISHQIAGPIVFVSGIVIALIMLILTLTGALQTLANWIPKEVVRGIQFGLGLKLAKVAFMQYFPSMGNIGIAVALACGVLFLLLRKQRIVPVSLLILALGILFSFFTYGITPFSQGYSLPFTIPHIPLNWEIVIQATLLLVLPQIPLSIGNSILATKQVADDFFPECRISFRRIGLSYGLLNLLSAPLGGIPVCHGSGGMAGHVAFGARSGGSLILYGFAMMLIGVAHLLGFSKILLLFPLPVLGVILLVEACTLISLLRNLSNNGASLSLAICVGLIAVLFPYGFILSMLVGTTLYYLPSIRQIITSPTKVLSFESRRW